MKKNLLILYGALMLFPVISLAETKSVFDLIDTGQALLQALSPLIMSLAVIYFVWALMQYLLKEGEERAKAKDAMVWGIIILFVMISVWGLVEILDNTVFR